MALSDKIAKQLPYLRRHARMLTGSQQLGDSLVRELLEAALMDEELRADISNSRVTLFQAFSKIYGSTGAQLGATAPEATGDAATVAGRLERVTPKARQALLLNAIEDFSIDEIGEIFECTPQEAQGLIDQAIGDIAEDSRAEVLIIEDEPLIALQLEDLVTELGHRVVGRARTHSEAVSMFKAHPTGLVLADIQLADGSSGIDAVNEILEDFSVPVIFITAFPERLLTGERPEPTYLIPKPFSEEFVRATIAQVMFFGSTAPVL